MKVAICVLLSLLTLRGETTLAQRILDLPAGAAVELRMNDKRRIRGRLATVEQDGFSVRVAKGNAIETERLSFADVKSVKHLRKTPASGVAGYVALGVAAGVGFFILLVYLANN